MSRIAKKPVAVPASVEVRQAEELLTVKGPKGTLSQRIHALVDVKLVDGELTFSPRGPSTLANAIAGTTRALVNNMITGVSRGFERKLELVGVGYRAQAKGKVLNLTLGYSHPIDYPLPEGVSAETPSQTEILLKGNDRQLVGQVAAKIRSFRPPEPYKGKGIRYSDEVIIRKEAKKK